MKKAKSIHFSQLSHQLLNVLARILISVIYILAHVTTDIEAIYTVLFLMWKEIQIEIMFTYIHIDTQYFNQFLYLAHFEQIHCKTKNKTKRHDTVSDQPHTSQTIK